MCNIGLVLKSPAAGFPPKLMILALPSSVVFEGFPEQRVPLPPTVY